MKITPVSREIYTLSDFSFRAAAGLRYAVFDLEATGPDETEDSITQIGAVEVQYPDRPEAEAFVTYVKPRKPIPSKIEELTGVTNRHVADAPAFTAAYSEFRAFVRDAVLVTQCGYEYDFPLLDMECGRNGLPPMPNFRLDTKAIFALLHPNRTETFSTNFLSGYYRIDRSAFKRHDALGDAHLIAKIFAAQMEEACEMGIDSLVTTRPVAIKRFVLSPL